MRGGKGVHLGLRVCVYLPPDCGKVPPTSHLESEGSGQLARDLGETQLAFSTALLPPEFMGVLSFKSVPQIYFCGIHTTTHYSHIHTHTTTTSLMRSTGARSWRGHPSHPGATQIGPAKILSALGLQCVLMLQCTSLLQAGLRVQIISQVGCKQQQ